MTRPTATVTWSDGSRDRWADVVQVAPGERYDIAFTATEPGKWAFHCHIGHHLTNNGASPGGLMLVVNVA